MNAKDAIRSAMNMGLFVLEKYTSDMSDADLLRRPAAGCNHLAWQLGHLISSESALVNMVAPGQGAELPAGFRETHSKNNTSSDDPAKFATKDEYHRLYRQVRTQTLAVLERLSDDELAAPGPENFRAMFPTVLDLFTLIATHPTVHAGQFVVVRRLLGKPVLI
jgi:hypothetical protein